MFNIFKSFHSLNRYQKLVIQINDEFGKIKMLTGDELRDKAKELSSLIYQEIAPLTAEVENIKEKLSRVNDFDIVKFPEIFRELENSEKEKLSTCEKILEKYISPAFAIVKGTCLLFSMGSIRVKATDIDYRLSEARDFITIDEDFAIYNNKWEAGGKEMVWDIVPHDTQLLAGISLQYGEIVEMLNGEGKTLAALFPLFLNAIAGRNIHVCTANDFLANRDYKWMRPLLEFYGIGVACLNDGMVNEDKQAKYQAKIVYGIASEFALDYLRDNMVQMLDEKNQYVRDFILIDEIDQVLIDNARESLNISGPLTNQEAVQGLYAELSQVAASLVSQQEQKIEMYFEQGKELFDSKEYDDACFFFYLVKRGSPENPQFYNYLNLTPDVLSRFNSYLKSQPLKENFQRFEDHLWYYFERGKAEFSPKGKIMVEESLANKEFWAFPDFDEELKLIEESTNDYTEKFLARQHLVDLYENIEQSHKIFRQLIDAYTYYSKDIDYIVEAGKVLIVDKITGRVMRESRYSDGLHQALEAKEGLSINNLTETVATITLQSFFQKYNKLAGMTATAKTDEKEYKEIYKKDVVSIPAYKKTIRIDYDDIVYKTKREKIKGVLDETKHLIKTFRPVLIGTTSVEDSELLSQVFKFNDVPHNLLNAKQDEEESLIISLAGQRGTVTIAAMMAGRGTDIELSQESVNAGGLAVIGFERHESRRLDSQLRGRAGRQGDPGSSQFFISLEDELMRSFGSDKIAVLMEKMGYKENEIIQHSMITKSIERAQKKIEQRSLNERSNLFQYDSSLNLIRDEIYKKRDHAITGYGVKFDLIRMFDDVCFNIINTLKIEDIDDFTAKVFDTFNYKTSISINELRLLSHDELCDRLSIEAFNNYTDKAEKLRTQVSPVIQNIRTEQGEHLINVVIPFSFKLLSMQVLSNIDDVIRSSGYEVIRRLEGSVIVNSIDLHWKGFLKKHESTRKDTDSLSELGIQNPLLKFKERITEYYEEFLDKISFDVVSKLCYAHIPVGAQKEDIPVDNIVEEAAESEPLFNNLVKDETEVLQLNESNADLIYQTIGNDTTGNSAWYFILVDRDKKDAFLAHTAGDAYDLAEYGKIIASGYGADIPDEIKQELKEKYGFNNFL
jgi:preprotein translocase subunit SecA